MTIKRLTIIILTVVLSCTIFQGCAVFSVQNKLENGDLVFVTAKKQGLSGAINAVTQQKEHAAFDHVGIVEKKDKKLYVLHASSKGGSQKQSLSDFKNAQKEEGQQIIVYRLKKPFQNSIPSAINEANRMLRKPYNFTYVLNEDTYYCSDFVERAFRAYQIFKLEPMTFKDAKTGVTHEFWSTFYKKQHMKVPEGELGCNPNGLAASDKLQEIMKL